MDGEKVAEPEWLEEEGDTPGTGTLICGIPFNVLNITSFL